MAVLTLSISAIILFFSAPTALGQLYVKVGVMKKPMNLNPFGATDAWSKRVLMLIYHPL
jgi:hypothetical protein